MSDFENFDNASPKPPQPTVPFTNLLLERSLLGCCLIDEDAIALVSLHLKPDDLYDVRHKWVYAKMLELFKTNSQCDSVSVYMALGDDAPRVGMAYMLELAESVGSTLAVEKYAQDLAAMAVAFKLYSRMTTVLTKAPTMEREAWVAEAMACVQNVDVAGIRQMESAEQLASQLWQEAESPDENLVTHKTGMDAFDKATGGLVHGVTVIGARSGMGKTALAHSLLVKIARQQRGAVLYFSIETDNRETFKRIASQQTEIPYKNIFQNRLDIGDKAVYRDALGELASLPMYFLDVGKLTPSRIRAEAIRHKQQHGLACVIVDYIQEVRPDRFIPEKRLAVGNVATELRDLARDLQVNVIICSQLSRDCELHKREPEMNDLAESTIIENVASQIIMPFRPAHWGIIDPATGAVYADDYAEYIVRKNRNGMTGKAVTTWTGHLVRYDS